MQIVQFTSEDQGKTVEFMKQIYQEMHWYKHPLTGVDNLKKEFKIPHNGMLFLVKNQNVILGTGGWIKINVNDALLKRFFIAKEVRGTGVANTLFNKLLEAAKTKNVSRILIDVSKNNSKAIHFFNTKGFKRYRQEPIEGWSESEMPDIFNYYFLTI